MYIWKNEEIEKILTQLDEQEVPFRKYAYTRKNGRLQLLGQGGFALVYGAERREGGRCEYAMKVIGFGEKHVDSQFFENTVMAQKNTGYLQNNVVKIYDYAERFVWIDENCCVISVQEKEKEFPGANCLKLQFILMEKLEPVLQRNKSGRVKLVPEELLWGGEQEILKLAYDIGRALSFAHKQKILHRDVKLENIFYEAKGKHYKLGDFGIARVTDDGIASTSAGTKGYSAPEVVGSLEEGYDNTADIYSFGMLLYVLLNDLKFPDSDYYHTNVKMQYQRGYVLPPPANGSEELYLIIKKMCRYEPDDRYQSMDEVLNDLENLIFHSDISYRREHKDASLAIGALLLFLGVIAWKLTFKPGLVIELSKMVYLFLALSAGKWILKLMRKNMIAISVVILGVGGCLMTSSGFSWMKLLLLLCVTFSSGDFAGFFAGAILTANVVSLVTRQNQQISGNCRDYCWVAVALLSLAAVLMVQYYVLQDRDYGLTVIYLKKYRYWFVVFLLYMSICFYGFVTRGRDMQGEIFGEALTLGLLTHEPMKVGAFGAGFSILWMIREKILIQLNCRRRQNGSF